MIAFPGPASRHRTIGVNVGGVTVGSGAPIVVQSMTNTDTADAEAPQSRRPPWRAPVRKSCASRWIVTRRRRPCPISKIGLRR